MAVKVPSPNHWTSGEFSFLHSLNKLLLKGFMNMPGPGMPQDGERGGQANEPLERGLLFCFWREEEQGGWEGQERPRVP